MRETFTYVEDEMDVETDYLFYWFVDNMPRFIFIALTDNNNNEKKQTVYAHRSTALCSNSLCGCMDCEPHRCACVRVFSCAHSGLPSAALCGHCGW